MSVGSPERPNPTFDVDVAALIEVVMLRRLRNRVGAAIDQAKAKAKPGFAKNKRKLTG